MRKLFFDGKICDGCAEIMNEGEDIVVCPECGTPQHRECYNKNNACVNAHLHAEGFDWQKENIKPEEPPKTAEVTGNSAPILNPDGGIPEVALPMFNAQSIVIDGRTVSTSKEFNGIRIREALTYLQINANKYIKKFMKNEHKKNFISWNWGAFFFTPAWFFYRKLYKAGAFFLTFVIAATLMVTPFTNIISENAEAYTAAFTEYREAVSAYMEDSSAENEAALDTALDAAFAEFVKVAPATAIYYLATFVIPSLAAAIMANSLYRNKMLDDIRIAKRATSDPNIQRYSLLRRGGVSIFAGFAALMAESYLPSVIMSVIKNFI